MSIIEEHKEIVYIAVIALAIALAGIIVLSIFSYQTPKLKSQPSNANMFKWGDVYNINSVSGYKYEIINIFDDSIERITVLYLKSYDEDENIKIQLVTFDEVAQRNVNASIIMDPATYKCMRKYYNGKVIECSQEFSDYKTHLGEFALPTLLNRDESFPQASVDNIVYKQKYHEAIKLKIEMESETISVWTSEGIALPARIEIVKSNGDHIIANLKSYN